LLRAQENRVATLQSLSGTGSLRVAAQFIGKFLPGTTAYLSNPTWGNHKVCVPGLLLGPLLVCIFSLCAAIRQR
jgi:aspartate/tyrosine/aromatic aminotransferase